MHSAQERCARWLVMAHDRPGTDGFQLNHEFLAELLGIHRSSVTIVARTLQTAGLISYRRSQIMITNGTASKGPRVSVTRWFPRR